MTGPSRPILPPEAEQEILSLLFEGMGIESAEMAAILKKHGVSGDMETLQDSYRKRLGQAGTRAAGVKCWPPAREGMWCWRAVETGSSSRPSAAASRGRSMG